MSTDRSPPSGAADAGPRPIPDYESAITSLRRRLLPAAPAPAHQPSGHRARAPEQGSAPEPNPRPVRRPVGLRMALAAIVIGGVAGATVLGLRRSGSGDPTSRSRTERGERLAPPDPAASRRPAVTSPAALASPVTGAATSSSVPGITASPSATASAASGAPTRANVRGGRPGAVLPPAARPSASSDPGIEGESGALAPAQRRSLRRRLVRACEQERYAAGVQAGRKLREHDALDWGAMLCFAAALRNVGAAAEAAATYRTFLERYPGNRHVKDAREALAELTGGGPGGAGSVR